jgi:threonine dehydratase
LGVCQELSPGTKVHTVEPQGFDDMRLSLLAGDRVSNTRTSGSICDALLAVSPGELTFNAIRDYAGHGLVVSDEEVKHAMRVGFTNFKLVLEPGGAAALAAVVGGKIDIEGKVVVVIASGGNVDPAMYSLCLQAPPSV